MTTLPYRTLVKPSEAELIVQKSRFLAFASPADSEAAALQFVRRHKDAHKQANHYCYAYIIGTNAGIMRYQDDGEPGGTAGIPILEAMRARHLVNSAVVVVRYFGGTLLGAGGLTRTYAKAAGQAITASGIVTMEPSYLVSISVPYSLWDRVQHAMSTLPVLSLDSSFSDKVIHAYVVKAQNDAQVAAKITAISDARVEIVDKEELSYAWPLEGDSA